jgi:hypothetical protein
MQHQYLLLSLLFICHFLGDYVFTTPRMLEAKQNGKPLGPIAAHAGVHAILMYVAMYFLVLFESLIMMTLFQFFAHFFTDVLKGRLQFYFPKLADTKNKSHWILFGADQLAHSAAIIYMCWNISQR